MASAGLDALGVDPYSWAMWSSYAARQAAIAGRAATKRFVHALLVAAALVAGLDARADDGPRIAVLGDSLTAGFGLLAEQAFPALLEARLREDGIAATVLNAGVSGDTTAGGLARLDWVLGDDATAAPGYVIVALGANDALRGLDPDAAYQNLAAIIEELQRRGIEILLAGMRAPASMGADYENAFVAIFPRLAQAYDVALYPFFLDGVATDPSLNQADGIHPNELGVTIMVDRILPTVRDWLAARN